VENEVMYYAAEANMSHMEQKREAKAEEESEELIQFDETDMVHKFVQV